MIFRVSQELNVLYNEGIIGTNPGRTLGACGIETNGFVVGDAVTERFDRLKLIIYFSLTLALCF